MKRYTLSEVKESYEQKCDWEKQFPVSRFIFRPASFLLTALLLRVTTSAPAVAWTGLGIGLAASALLVNMSYFGPWPGVAGLALFALLDAADGNIARTTHSVTLYGKMLDGMLGKLAEGLYMPALGVGLYLCGAPYTPAPAAWFMLAAGFAALCAFLYSSIFESTFDFFSLQKKIPAETPALTAKIASSRFRGNLLYTVFVNIHAFNVQVLLLTLAAVFGYSALVFFIYAMAVYYGIRMSVVFVYYMRRASSELV